LGASKILCADWFIRRLLGVREFITRTAFVNKLTPLNHVSYYCYRSFFGIDQSDFITKNYQFSSKKTTLEL